MRRTSYQQGSLKLADRKKGKVWEFRWREVQVDGSTRRKNIVIGTLREFANESAAQTAVDALRLRINQQTPQQNIKNISSETLVKHYREHELPDIFNEIKPTPDAVEEDRKSYATQVTYEGYLGKWILPRWRSYRLSDVKAVDVEKWLKTLCFQKTGTPLARGSKAKIRNIMSALYSHAIRLGVGGPQSDHERSPECKATESTRHPGSGRDRCNSEGVARTSPNHDRVGCFHGFAPRRTHRSPMGGRGFRSLGPSHSEIGCRHGARVAEDRSVAKRRAVRRATRRVSIHVETTVRLCDPGRLGVRISANEGKAAVLAGHTVAILRSTGPQACKGDQERDLPYIPTHLWNAPERERRKCQGRSGTSSPRKPESDDRRLYAGRQLTKARGSEQARKHGYERSRSCEIARNLLSGPNWTMKENGDFAEVLYFVGVPDGI